MSAIIEGVKSTLHENFTGGNALANADNQFTVDDVPSQTGKVAVVTGGSEGIGYGFVHGLLQHDIKKVFVLSLSKEVFEGAQKSIGEDLGTDKANRLHWIRCDLADWAAVTNVAKEITDNTDRLDILFNNSGRGIMTYQLTDYGVDRHMALNHMGHVVLTSHLLPLIKKTASSGNTVRIVNQASNAHQNAPKDVKFASLDELNQDLGPMPQYGRSKLANILYAKYLNKHLTSQQPNILANATHPGVVKTKMSEKDIHEPYPVLGTLMSVGLAAFKKDQFEGALSALYAATKIEKSGRYICPPAVDEPGSELANNEELAEQLMRLTTSVITDKTRSASVDKGCPMTPY